MKIKKILTIVITVLAAGMAIMSGVVKLTKTLGIEERMAAMHVEKYINILGIMELVFATLFLIPKTMKIGFILLTCYFAGAMGVELSYGTGFNAAPIMILIWLSAFLRNRSIFI